MGSKSSLSKASLCRPDMAKGTVEFKATVPVVQKHVPRHVGDQIIEIMTPAIERVLDLPYVVGNEVEVEAASRSRVTKATVTNVRREVRKSC